MIRGEDVFLGPTMNTVNACPSLFAQADTTYSMDDSNSPTMPRQRKRKNDDANLTEEERLKKKKNRDAAKKCREKKEKEAKQLKERNAELEKENEELSKEKINLENKITEIRHIISDHMNKGCKLPPQIQEIWDQEFGTASRMNELTDNGTQDFIQVGTMEVQNSRMHTPPHTPDSSSSGRLSPTPSTTFMESSAAPTPMPVSLFSGAPIQHQNAGRKNSSSSRSPSASPGPASYTGAPKGDSVLHIQDLSQHLLTSKAIPPALAPIQVSANSHIKISSNYLLKDRLSISEINSQVQMVPTVVLDDDSEEGEESREDESYTPQTNDRVAWVRVPEDSMSKAFEHPDVPSVDLISNELFKGKEYYRSEQILTEGENLSSLGFNAPVGYSFAEDLEEPEPVQNIMQYASSSEPLVNSNGRLSKISTQNTSDVFSAQDTSDVSIAACAPALLSLGPDLSPTLQEQIKSLNKSNSNPALPIIFLQNQQHILGDDGQQYTIQLIHSSAPQQNTISNNPKYTNVPASSSLQAPQQQGQQSTLTVVSPEYVRGLSFQERDQRVAQTQQASSSFVVSKGLPQIRNLPAGVSNNIIPMISKQQRAAQQFTSVAQIVVSSSQQMPTALTHASPARLQGSVQNHVITSQANKAAPSRQQTPIPNTVATSQANQIIGRMQAVQNLPSGDFSSAVNDLPSLNFNEMDQENIFEKTRATNVS